MVFTLAQKAGLVALGDVFGQAKTGRRPDDRQT